MLHETESRREELESEYNARFDYHHELWHREREEARREAEMEAAFYEALHEEREESRLLALEAELDALAASYEPPSFDGECGDCFGPVMAGRCLCCGRDA